ncbi:MAG TPA: ATP-binding cassette domain-containing protein [Candidatus Omnitrophota bacterium]|nr:ATP-binding cassette domain-containing protein [Candidatus Omnitrophota bacterium]
MITINNLNMGFTNRTLFKDVSLSIFPNEKIGLTGPNGSGKTTLFSIILGEQESIAGSVTVQKNLRIGFLPQEAKYQSSKTVMEEMTEGDDHIRRIMDEKRKLEDEHRADSPRYGDIMEEMEHLGVYELEHKAEKILTGLGFKPEDFHRPIKDLSGGWQMRTLLAKMLVYPFDLLLLDEPTNHLDLPATLWLKEFLKTYPGSFILISHDRVFLNEVTNYTIVLENQRVFKVKGNYEAFELQRGIENKTLEKKQKVVEKKREQLERFAQRFHAQPNRASAVRNKRKMIERLENIELPQEYKTISDFGFSDIKRSGYQVVTMDKIYKSYADKQVYKDMHFEIIRGQKVCLVGPNGAGKSTLMKMLAGTIKPDSGDIKFGHQVDVGYYSQARLDVLNPERNAFEEVLASAPQGTQAVRARSLLGLFNFHGDDVFKQVKVLSGGEKSRLILAKLLIDPPNFMLLDEPTTHLDLDGIKALTKAFQQFEGTVCFISHDLYFIKEIANCIVDVQQGQLTTYLGGLDYYLEKKQGKEDAAMKEKKGLAKEAASAGKHSAKKDGGASKASEAHDELHQKHKQALKRKEHIKKEIILLQKEFKDLEMESYVKSRHLSQSFDKRDETTLKEYGQRLKEIQRRQREIESTIKQLEEEKIRISR